MHGNSMGAGGFHDWFRAQHFEYAEQEAIDYFNEVFWATKEP